jgi:WD40 repeat protein
MLNIYHRDLSSAKQSESLPAVGSISTHTRPVEALEKSLQPSTPREGPLTLFTSDSMGVLKAWDIHKETDGGRPIWRSSSKADLANHRTGINQLSFGDGQLWSGNPIYPMHIYNSHIWLNYLASTDETIQVQHYPPDKTQKPYPPITEKKAVKAILLLQLHPQLSAGAFPYLLVATGDIIRVYDVSSLDEPELIRDVEGHWHEVTGFQVWLRDVKDRKGKEVWIVSSSLDRTLRKWRLSGKVTFCISVISLLIYI